MSFVSTSLICFFLSSIINISAAEQIYVIIAPPGDDSTGRCSFIYEINKNNISMASPIDVGESLSGMLLDEKGKRLYVYGNTNTEGGYLTAIELKKGFPREATRLPVAPDLGINLGALSTTLLYMWFPENAQSPNRYNLFEIDTTKNSVKKVDQSHYQMDFTGYFQNEIFSNRMIVSVNSDRAISFRHGLQCNDTGLVVPGELSKKVLSDKKQDNWYCFASDENVFCLTGCDSVNKISICAIFSRKNKSWSTINLIDRQSVIWANRSGFFTGIRSPEESDKMSDIEFHKYDLLNHWNVSIPSPGNIIYGDNEKIIVHIDKSLFIGELKEGNSEIATHILASNDLLSKACSAFTLTETKH